LWVTPDALPTEVRPGVVWGFRARKLDLVVGEQGVDYPFVHKFDGDSSGWINIAVLQVYQR
jgi:hypothetical protein